MAYFIGEHKALAAGRKRIAEEDIICYLDVMFFDRNYCSYEGRIFGKDVRQPKREFMFKKTSEGIFIENAYYVKGSSFGCNAEFIIPAGTEYYYSSLYEDYIAESIMFVKYTVSEWQCMMETLGRVSQD